MLQQMTEIAIQLDDALLTRLRAIAVRDGRALEDLIADGAHLIAANEDEPAHEFTARQIALIRQSLDDPQPSIPHDEAMAKIEAILDDTK
jgi:hypothetical protein